MNVRPYCPLKKHSNGSNQSIYQRYIFFPKFGNHVVSDWGAQSWIYFEGYIINNINKINDA